MDSAVSVLMSEARDVIRLNGFRFYYPNIAAIRFGKQYGLQGRN